LRDALSLQSEVAGQVATALDVRLLSTGDEAPEASLSKPASTNPVAYDLYLKAKLQLDAGFSGLETASDYERLEAIVARAIELDPAFANA
jgi:hypothetical protein